MTSTTLPHTWIGSPNHYRGRQGHRITHITLHVMAGYLAGTDSTFQRGTASAHYGIGGDGTIHQYVDEDDGSWSDANRVSNLSTVSIEHEGGIPKAAMTAACIEASAQLCADIARRQGWTRLWHDGLDGNVWLHREIPGTDHADCPDLAPNGLPYRQVIDQANQLLQGDGNVTAQDLYDTKGNDGRNIFDSVIQTRNELRDRSQEGAEKALVELKGNDGRNVLDSVIQARYDIAELKEMIAQQNAAIARLTQEAGK